MRLSVCAGIYEWHVCMYLYVHVSMHAILIFMGAVYDQSHIYLSVYVCLQKTRVLCVSVSVCVSACVRARLLILHSFFEQGKVDVESFACYKEFYFYFMAWFTDSTLKSHLYHIMPRM